MAARALFVLLLALAACNDSHDPNDRYFFALRWAFVDGRNCADAGVNLLRLQTADTMLVRATLGSCESGRIGNAAAEPQSVGQLPGGEHPYVLEALTPSGGVLYRVRFTVDPSLHPELDVTLVFVGGA